MYATIASTQSVVLSRRAGPAQRRTRPAPIVAMAASKKEGAPKKAKASDERRRAPAAVATAAAAIVASTVASPLAAYRCARDTTVSRRPSGPTRPNHHRTNRFLRCHV